MNFSDPPPKEPYVPVELRPCGGQCGRDPALRGSTGWVKWAVILLCLIAAVLAYAVAGCAMKCNNCPPESAVSE